MTSGHWAITKQQMSIVYEITGYSKATNNRRKPNNDEKDKNNLLHTSIPILGGEQLVKKAEI